MPIYKSGCSGLSSGSTTWECEFAAYFVLVLVDSKLNESKATWKHGKVWGHCFMQTLEISL